MKKIFSLFLSLFITVIYSQKTVSGIVKDHEGAPVSSASVTVEEVGKDAIVSYGITNSKGEYKVTFTSSDSSVELKVKAYNHKPIIKTIKNETQTQNFNLEVQATEIKEVKLKAKIITKKGDTISYDLKAFENKSDRTLADVMKKIPGIDINPDGTILYQGNAINKFYVNGKDLMEGSYGAINNSLPKDAVQKVEVLENHQPVKILQDRVPSDAAAINVKLKNSVTMTGRGEVSSGFLDPWLWNVKLTPMFFGQKSQWVVNYKTNNVGETVENEGNMLSFGGGWEGIRRATSQNAWLNVENAGTPSLPEKRYLMNNVHYLSANYLVNPFKNKEWELKANASYTNNVVSRESFSETNNYLNNSHVETNILNHFYTDKAKGELIFTKNAKKGFFKNTTTFTQFWNAEKADVNRNATSAAEALQSPTTSFQNSLSTIIPWKKTMVNLMSYVSYQKDTQNLDVSPSSYVVLLSPTSDFIRQNFSLNNFEADHSANIGFVKKKWTFTPEIGLNYNANKLQTNLDGIMPASGLTTNDYVNDLKFTNAVPYGALGINYKSDSWMLFSKLPVNFNNVSAQDDLRNISKSVNKVTFEPNFFAQYSFASFWKASLNGSIGNNFGNINNIYGGLLLLSPSSLTRMNSSNPISEANSKSIGSRIEYRNPLNNLFFNVGYRYGLSKKNLIASPFVDALGFTRMDYVEMNNSSESNNYSAEVGKYFPKFKTNASISYGNTLSHSQSLQDANLFSGTTNSQNIGFKFNNSYFSWLSVDYNLTYLWKAQRVYNNPNSKTNAYTHNFAVYVYPVENHIIGFNWNQINSENQDTNFHNAFYDLSYQYTWAKKKLDFELKWQNMMNRKIYETFSVSSFSDSYTRYQLRPSQVMFTVKFNFK